MPGRAGAVFSGARAAAAARGGGARPPWGLPFFPARGLDPRGARRRHAPSWAARGPGRRGKDPLLGAPRFLLFADRRGRRRSLYLHPLSVLTPTPITSLHYQFVADGVFYAELNELLTRELAEQVRPRGRKMGGDG